MMLSLNNLCGFGHTQSGGPVLSFISYSTNTTSAGVLPAGAQVGDLLVAVIPYSKMNTTGWTFLDYLGPVYVNGGCFIRVVTGGDSLIYDSYESTITGCYRGTGFNFGAITSIHDTYESTKKYNFAAIGAGYAGIIAHATRGTDAAGDTTYTNATRNVSTYGLSKVFPSSLGLVTSPTTTSSVEYANSATYVDSSYTGGVIIKIPII